MRLVGQAFAGNRGVSAVEISSDGATWSPVDTIQQVAPLSWAIWRSTWNPLEAGTFTLRVRAIDGNGDVQVASKRSPIPDGATGYHSVDIGVT